jgi:ABC-type transport system involved in multi-copper enzyme maturation permease subunit
MTAFGWALHAEWTKFRTIRGWVIGLLIALIATIGLGTVSSSSCNGAACPSPPIGPTGQAVQDTFPFAHQSLTGNGTITARLTSLAAVNQSAPPGQEPDQLSTLVPWAKAGIIIKASTTAGSAYAAMMVTGGHGIRMQWDYVYDVPGLTGNVSASSPRWLRLVRSGDTITGYDSTDGTNWTRIDSVTLPGLPSTVQAGLFTASPVYVHSAGSGMGGQSSYVEGTDATGTFDHVSLSWPATSWTDTQMEGNGSLGSIPGSIHLTGGAGTITGSGDIAPVIAGIGGADGGIGLRATLVGTFAALLILIVLGAMFVTAEYRRGLIRTTFTASANRVRVLAAKAAVVGATGFVVGLIAIAVAIPVFTDALHGNGNPSLPVPLPTEIRVVIGTGLLLGVAAVLALAVGTIVRRSAVAITTVFVAVFIPYLITAVPALPTNVEDWLLRVTPAAGFALQQPYPQYYQVIAQYRPFDGYSPLNPWAGFAVECAWAVAALAVAGYLLRRRDA